MNIFMFFYITVPKLYRKKRFKRFKEQKQIIKKIIFLIGRRKVGGIIF